jgi:hypothetical protein
MLKTKLVAAALAAIVVAGSLTAGVSVASAASATKPPVKLLTCKAPLVATPVKETVLGKVNTVWKCEAKPASKKA